MARRRVAYGGFVVQALGRLRVEHENAVVRARPAVVASARLGCGARPGRAHSPRSVCRAALFHDHGHDRIFVRLASFLVYPDDLVYPHVADEVAHDKHEICLDDSMRVDVAHGVSGREGFFGRDNRDDLYACAGLRPFGSSKTPSRSAVGSTRTWPSKFRLPLLDMT